MSKELEEAVNIALKGATVGEDGKTTYPEGTNKNIAYMANLEKRRRDTQTSLTKEQERATVLETENAKLMDSWEQEVASALTDDQRSELDELKVTDPEMWREKLNAYEGENKTRVKAKQAKIKEDVTKETELERRTRLLTEYNEANPEHALTDEVIDNDLPPRITKQLEAGTITFDEFLDKAGTYLGTPKVLDEGEAPSGEPDLSDLGGKDKPSDASVEADIATSYKDEIY